MNVALQVLPPLRHIHLCPAQAPRKLRHCKPLQAPHQIRNSYIPSSLYSGSLGYVATWGPDGQGERMVRSGSRTSYQIEMLRAVGNARNFGPLYLVFLDPCSKTPFNLAPSEVIEPVSSGRSPRKYVQGLHSVDARTGTRPRSLKECFWRKAVAVACMNGGTPDLA